MLASISEACFCLGGSPLSRTLASSRMPPSRISQICFRQTPFPPCKHCAFRFTAESGLAQRAAFVMPAPATKIAKAGLQYRKLIGATRATCYLLHFVLLWRLEAARFCNYLYEFRVPNSSPRVPRKRLILRTCRAFAKQTAFSILAAPNMLHPRR